MPSAQHSGSGRFWMRARGLKRYARVYSIAGAASTRLRCGCGAGGRLSGAVPEGGGVRDHGRRCLIHLTGWCPIAMYGARVGAIFTIQLPKKLPKFMIARVYRAISERPHPGGPAISDRRREIGLRPREIGV